MRRHSPWLLLVLLLAGGRCASAQTATAEVDPLQCWWRASAGAIRVGEVFSVVLTCSVLDSSAVTAVPDQGPLEPASIQLPPFEVIGGTHLTDLRAGDRRFFQYEYRLRLVNEDLFGKDAAIPEVKITYRIRSQVNGAALEGAEKTYLLPVLPIRVLSLVPAGATDIRDSTAGTFADVESTRLRANLLVTTGAVLAALGVVLAVAALVRAVVRAGAGGASARRALATDAEILRGVQSELARIARARRGEGWTPALATDLLTAVRLVGGFMLGRPAGIRSQSADNRPQEGQLVLPRSLGRSHEVVVSAYVTPRDVECELQTLRRRSDPAEQQARLLALEELHGTLLALTAGQYGRQRLDSGTLDRALEAAGRMLSRVRRAYTWPVRTLRAASRATVDFRQRVWSR